MSADSFVVADLNIDDAKTEGEFMRKFKKEEFGNTLPFVVVTSSTGKALASSGGAKSAEEWNALLDEAKKKAGAPEAAAPGTAAPAAPAAGAKDANWPFKTAPKK